MSLLIGPSAKNLEKDRVLSGRSGTVKSPVENSREGRCAGLHGLTLTKNP